MEDWREELLSAHQWLVDRVLRTVWGRVPGTVGRDELRSSGLLGLAQAASRFDPDSDVTFTTFAEHRVRGAMLDCVRQWEHLPRRQVELDRRIAAAESELRSVTAAAPTDPEIADHLGEDIQTITGSRAWRRSRGRSPDIESATGDSAPSGSLVDPESADPFDRVLDRQLLDQMTAALAALPPRHREVIEAIYLRGVPPGVLARELQVTPTRVSQIRARALELLRQSMTPPPQIDGSDARETPRTHAGAITCRTQPEGPAAPDPPGPQ